jgi:hypothetical protein
MPKSLVNDLKYSDAEDKSKNNMVCENEKNTPNQIEN